MNMGCTPWGAPLKVDSKLRNKKKLKMQKSS